MKKIKAFVMMAMIALVTLTGFSSCRDEGIAESLDGIWRGYTYSTYDNYSSYETEIEFIPNGSFSSSGTGTWVDYYKSNYWGNRNYVCYRMTWTVDNGDIHIRLSDGSRIVIYHYTLNNRYFDGTLEIDGRTGSFRLDRITAPRNGSWDEYDYYNGYSYNQSKGSRAETDSVEGPKHGFALPKE